MDDILAVEPLPSIRLVIRGPLQRCYELFHLENYFNGVASPHLSLHSARFIAFCLFCSAFDILNLLARRENCQPRHAPAKSPSGAQLVATNCSLLSPLPVRSDWQNMPGPLLDAALSLSDMYVKNIRLS